MSGKVENKKKYIYQLEQRDFENFKNGSNKDWFRPNKNFFGLVCFKYEINIGVRPETTYAFQVAQNMFIYM